MQEPNDVPELERGEAFLLCVTVFLAFSLLKKAPAVCEVRLHFVVINHIAASVYVNLHLILHLSAAMPGFQWVGEKNQSRGYCVIVAVQSIHLIYLNKNHISGQIKTQFLKTVLMSQLFLGTPLNKKAHIN